MKSLTRMWSWTKLFFNLIRVSVNPKNTAAGLAVAEDLYDLGFMKVEVEKVSSRPENRACINERKPLRGIDMKALEALPEGTVGRSYFNFLRENNLSVHFYKDLRVIDDEVFIMMRLRETHDLWHVITGFGTTREEELGLQAFMMAQVHSPLAPFLVGGAILISAIKDQAKAREAVSSVSRGWTLGLQSKDIFAIDWSQQWATPLTELRRRYGLLAAGKSEPISADELTPNSADYEVRIRLSDTGEIPI